MRTGRVVVGDAAPSLRRLPDASIDMVLTSPPYFRLRDYGVAGQLGLERHVDQWVDNLRKVSSELRRVLLPTGSFWLNLADSYATHPNQGAPGKSLLLGPERLALALLDDGWLLRNKLIWQKANPMPSSVRDRLSCSWDVIYIFVKQPRYFFDLDAIRIPCTSPPRLISRLPDGLRQRQPWQGPNAGRGRWQHAGAPDGTAGHPLGKNPGDVWRIAGSNYRGAHYATFPVELARRAIRAGSPEARCPRCRSPWQRRLIRSASGGARRSALGPSCDCSVGPEPAVVLDPFFGAGTTALAAEELGRDWLGIELNPAFAELAEQRIQTARVA
ncbi:MAG TPA: site-specific DNA-methyltransferase [Jatrophihabitans sp.]|nr:site-specific DNA-methyltransferase [Jatrophihabitans sp.]